MNSRSDGQATYDQLQGIANKVSLLLCDEGVSRGVAACALLSVAMSILVEDLGDVAGAEFAQSSIDEALACWRQQQGPAH